MYWWHARTYGLNLAIQFFSLKYGDSSDIFPKKSFVWIITPLFFFHQVTKTLPQKKTPNNVDANISFLVSKSTKTKT
jgi:hypothetical protein